MAAFLQHRVCRCLQSNLPTGKNQNIVSVYLMAIQVGHLFTQIEADLDGASEEERDEAWERFWKKKDPDPASEDNPFRDEIPYRSLYDNQGVSRIIE